MELEVSQDARLKDVDSELFVVGPIDQLSIDAGIAVHADVAAPSIYLATKKN